MVIKKNLMIADKPIMQNADYQPIVEDVLKANPDVVFCCCQLNTKDS
jgi:hypothetical protein